MDTLAGNVQARERIVRFVEVVTMRNLPAPYEKPQTLLHEGYEQHWMREQGRPASRLVFRGELASLEEYE
jgi:hypothetical protein